MRHVLMRARSVHVHGIQCEECSHVEFDIQERRPDRVTVAISATLWARYSAAVRTLDALTAEIRMIGDATTEAPDA